jgi:carbon storage regulator
VPRIEAICVGIRHTGTAALSPRRIDGDVSTIQKKNESIVINNDITVTVVEIRGDKVRLGIVAPKEVPVHRQEVYEAIHGKPADTEPNSNAVAKPVE